VAGHAKGTLLLHLSSHIVTSYGDAAWTRVRDALTAEDRAALPAIVVPSAWYPVGVWNRALKAHLDAHVADPRAEVIALASRVADADLHTLFKILLKVASAEAILRRAGWLWERYFDRGTIEVTDDTPRSFRLRLNAPTGADEGASEPTCAYGVVGWLSHALTMVGASNVSVKHTRCRFAHAKHCEYHVTW
jgi:hypothetical protein